MNESYRLGEQSIIAHLQRLANGASTGTVKILSQIDRGGLGPALL